MKKIIFFSFTLVVFLVCCKTTSKTTTVTTETKPVITEAEETYAKGKWADATKESLTEGYNLFITNCGKCHAFPNVKMHGEQKLGFIVPSMAKVQAKLTEAQGELILRYMLTKKNVTP